MSCRQKLSSRNQGFNRAPGSLEVPLRYRISIRDFHEWHDTTLVSFPLAFQPVNEASCRPLSPQPKPGVFASHVGGGGSGDCQSLADIPCNVVGGGPVNPSGDVVLTTVVADQSVARTQSPEAVAKMALASDVDVVQVSRQLPTPRGRSPSTHPRKVAPYLSRERQQQSVKETQQRSQLKNS